MTDNRQLHIQCAPHRGAVYKCIADMLSYPTQSLYSQWQGGELKQQLSLLLAELPYTIDCALAACDMPNFTEWASEYMRLFELPVDGQPCPLYGGIYASSRREVMEELLRYYHFFGLTTHGADQGDLPDSIPTLLEFMQFLALRESVSGDVATARNAQKDLLERHLTRWIPAIITPLRERKPLVFYSDVLNLLNRFVSLELQALATESAPSRSAGVASGTWK